MAAQMKYGYATPSGVPGGLFDISPYECNTRVSEAESGKIKFGMAVAAGTSAGTGVKVPAAASDFIEGIVVHKAHEMDNKGAVVIDKGEAFSVLRTGKVWARVDESVTIAVNDKPYVIATGDKAGLLTNAESGNIALAGRFIGVSEDGIAPVLLYNAEATAAAAKASGEI